MSDILQLQPTTREHFPAILDIFERCRTVMHGRGLRQWLNGYPGVPELESDFASGSAITLLCDGQIAGYAAVIRNGEPTYLHIEGGWLTDGKSYAAVHRVALDPALQSHGLGPRFFRALECQIAAEGFASVRIDTHDDNRPMRGMLDHLGFGYCGTIWIEDGTPRRAYERILSEPVIRPLTARDREAYLQMADEFYHTDAVLHPLPADCHERNLAEMLRPDGQLRGYILEWEEQPAGFAQIALNWSTEVGGRTVWVEDVFVRPAFRGKGLGQAFFRRLERDFGREALRYRLEVEEENEGAVRLYERLGFERLPYMQMIRDEASHE